MTSKFEQSVQIKYDNTEVFIVVRYDAPVCGRRTKSMFQSAAWHDGMMPQSAAWHDGMMPQSAAWHDEMMPQCSAWPLTPDTTAE